MNRRTQLLLGISTTVGLTLLLAWFAVQALVIRPAIGEREPLRIQEAQRAAELLQSGVSKREIEEGRGIDIRVLSGPAEGPPEGEGWISKQTEAGTIWKQEGGNYEIAVWSGQLWVVLQSHPPRATGLALGLLALGVPLIILVFGLGQRANRHQERAEEQMARIAAGDLGVRLDAEAGTPELRRVAVAVNQMASQLQALIEVDRKRMAGLSHELRTPLTRIRLELELARREGAAVERLDRIERDIEVFDALLQELLELSRLQLVGQQTMRPELVDLAGLAQLVVEENEWDDVELRGSGTATVDAALVARLLRNLLRNSAQHAPGSRRWVELEDGALSVGDEGPGIAVDRQATITEAFERSASSAGHGLGLAIAAQIATLHEGSLELSAPPGLVVRVSFGRPQRG